MRFLLGASDLIELGRSKIRRKAYTTKRGTHVKSSLVKDTGAPGRTPKSKRVLPAIVPGFLKGWKKDLSEGKRHSILKKVTQDEGCASTIRRLNLLANFTHRTSPETASRARADMAWVRDQSFCRLKGKTK